MPQGKLRRSRSNKMIAGVAGGMSEWMGLSSFWIRLLWFILLIPGGLPGILPYVICWIVIPQKD